MPKRRTSIFESWRQRVEIPDDPNACWEWRGHIMWAGYGTFNPGEGQSFRAHRWAYEHFIGPIPKGMHIDHLCRNRKCVNPKHMEPVTNWENTLRGNNFVGAYVKRTHCKNGHELAGANVRLHPVRGRVCRRCVRERGAEYYRRRVARAKAAISSDLLACQR